MMTNKIHLNTGVHHTSEQCKIYLITAVIPICILKFSNLYSEILYYLLVINNQNIHANK